jgi:hypothetical protein
MSRDQKKAAAWLFVVTGLLVITLEILFMVYGVRTEGIATRVPERQWNGYNHAPTVEFTGADGETRRERIMISFPEFDGITGEGESVEIEYLPGMESYVRPVGMGWAFWLTGGVVFAIGLGQLIIIHRSGW